jgi:hypothetical protein
MVFVQEGHAFAMSGSLESHVLPSLQLPLVQTTVLVVAFAKSETTLIHVFVTRVTKDLTAPSRVLFVRAIAPIADCVIAMGLVTVSLDSQALLAKMLPAHVTC